jgi:hypothetical protein
VSVSSRSSSSSSSSRSEGIQPNLHKDLGSTATAACLMQPFCRSYFGVCTQQASFAIGCAVAQALSRPGLQHTTASNAHLCWCLVSPLEHDLLFSVLGHHARACNHVSAAVLQPMKVQFGLMCVLCK